MLPEQILSLSAAKLAAAIRGGKLSAVDAITAYMDRAAVIHHATNCITYWMRADAMRRAEELDKHYADTGGSTVGPLHGVPCTVKDHFAVKGYPVTMGMSRLRRQADADAEADASGSSGGSKEDCSVVAALRDA